jgi:hypothetical protein
MRISIKHFCNLMLCQDEGNLIKQSKNSWVLFVILFVSRIEQESWWMLWSWRKGLE